ncbi:MAG: sulfatase-like hydrolase/transferase [Alphaproteobacteria bacterium]|nr:sulfatase-like hydrolase/transferase [Alphaproteobacteria bacterium]
MSKLTKIAILPAMMCMTALGSSVGTAPGYAATSSSPDASRPNVIIILADDLGYADTSANPGGRFETPNIDRIAEQGVRFTDGYATAPVCAPSRAGLLTGRYPERFGFEYNVGGAPRALREGLGLSTDQITIAQLLKDAGYHTGLIGKWHEGEQSQFYPMNRGFDEFVGFLPGASSYIDPTLPGVHLAFRGFSDDILHSLVLGKTRQIDRAALGATVGKELATKGAAANDQKLAKAGARLASTFERRPLNQIVEGADHHVVHNEDQYLTDYFADRAARYITENAKGGKPYFLYLAFNAPHMPFMVTDKYYDRFPEIKDHQLRVYAAMIAALDDGIGEVLNAVKQSGEADNTMIVFASDNGCAAYIPGLCSNTPLRGGKLSFYEGGIRVPFLMSWPGHITPGTVYHNPVSLMDVLPTALAASGGKLPTDRPYDGVDLMPYLSGRIAGPPHDMLIWQSKPLVAIRLGEWKLRETEKDANTSVYGHYKLLFNLRDDRNESTNLSQKDADKLRELEDLLHEWEIPMVAPKWPTKRPVTYQIDGITFTLPV